MRTDSFSSSTMAANTSTHRFVLNNRLLNGINLKTNAANTNQILVKDPESTRMVDEELQIVKREKSLTIVTTGTVVFLATAFMYLLIFS